MTLFQRIIQYLLKKLSPLKETDPEKAYNLWASGYDNQPDNLMLSLDEKLFKTFLGDVNLFNKSIADIGCGTGRYWKKILEEKPGKLVGYDVSDGMLGVLKKRFPGAETHRLLNNRLPGLVNNSIDLIISTLTIAHISNIEDALREWTRVLKPGGEIFITDYHPAALDKGGKRTFRHNHQTIAIKNNIHSVEKIKTIAGQLQLVVLRFVEEKIDDGMKPWYEKMNALHIFEQYKGVPIIYGILLKKTDATT